MPAADQDPAFDLRQACELIEGAGRNAFIGSQAGTENLRIALETAAEHLRTVLELAARAPVTLRASRQRLLEISETLSALELRVAFASDFVKDRNLSGAGSPLYSPGILASGDEMRDRTGNLIEAWS